MHENETLCNEIDSATTHAIESVKILASLAQKANNQLCTERGVFLDHTSSPTPACMKFCGIDVEEAARRVLEYDSLKERLKKEERERSALEVRCSAFEKMVREYQDEIVPNYRNRAKGAEERAKKAEQERDALSPYQVGDILYQAFENGIERFIITGLSVYIGHKDFYADDYEDGYVGFCEDGTYILAKRLNGKGKMRISAKMIDTESDYPFKTYSSLEAAEKAMKSMQGSQNA